MTSFRVKYKMIIKTPQWYREHTYPQWSDEQIYTHLKKKWGRRAVKGLVATLIAIATLYAKWEPIAEFSKSMFIDDNSNNVFYSDSDAEIYNWNHETQQFEREKKYNFWGDRK